jgi:hypothetical protein
VAASGAWTGADTFTLALCQYETPFTLNLVCRFSGERLQIELMPNFTFGPPPDRPPLVGVQHPPPKVRISNK